MSTLTTLWRNLNKGAGPLDHVWSRGAQEYTRKGTPKAGRGKVAGYVGRVPEADRVDVLLLNAQACYAGPDTRKRLKATRKREVFAWYRGEVASPAELAQVTRYTRGRRLGMNLRERGEVAFCYADTREPCPDTFAALWFTPDGLFTVDFD